MHLQTVIKWQGTKAQGRFIHTHKGITIQPHHGHKSEFMALIIPKAWMYMVLVEAHDKLGHQGVSCIYCLIR